MKSIKSQSMQSVRSVKSLRSFPGGTDEDKIIDFDEYVAMACKKFNCPQPVFVRKDLHRDDFFKTKKGGECTKYTKICIVTPSTKEDSVNNLDRNDAVAGGAMKSKPDLVSEDTITIDALYDNMIHLAEIRLNRVKKVPLVLMQLIGVIAPYYTSLTKISITRCGVDAYTIYELSKMLKLTSITDVCLDDCRVPEGNYAILLNTPSCLTGLSLCRCLINDEVCRQIALKLHYKTSADSNLSVLNLSSNCITDAGAKYIAEALRSNRHLRYLNLADNRLTDEGACHIFDTLIEFPLTHDETVNKRKRHMDYLNARRALYMKYLNEWESKSIEEYSQIGKKSATTKKGKSSATSLRSKVSARKEKEKIKCPSLADDDAFYRAEILANEMIGSFVDPFNASSTRIKDAYSYCVGNMFLCYLNLSYNNLTYVSVLKLHAVVLYQAGSIRPNQAGLVKIVLDGNYLPVACSEMKTISDIMHKNIACFGGRLSDYGARRKSRPTRVSMLPDRSTMLPK